MPIDLNQLPSNSENLCKKDSLPEGLFDFIVLSSTSLLVAIFFNLYNSTICKLYHGLSAFTTAGTDYRPPVAQIKNIEIQRLPNSVYCVMLLFCHLLVSVKIYTSANCVAASTGM
jgi:hypothetical protein